MDHALGCLLGVAVGDAAGAPLERRRYAGLVQPADAMRMPGLRVPGRPPLLGRGQTTDDTELTICLAQGLAGHPPWAGFPADSVAEQYAYWYSAGHFGGGQTCKAAFSVQAREGGRRGHQFRDDVEDHGGGSGSLATRMQARARQHSSDSKANGALMRVAPLAVWGHRLRPATIAQRAAADAALSHPNRTCQDCSAAYCIALAHMIRRRGNPQGALHDACEWAEAHAGAEVRQWLQEDSQLALDQLDVEESKGFVRHAFTLAFHHLRRGTPYEAAILQTLQLGGDTDTNAAIVGGMAGALHGIDSIPAYMLTPVLEYEGRHDQGGGTQRPAALRAARLPELAAELFEQAGS